MTSYLNPFLRESYWLVPIFTSSLANESDKWNSDLSTGVCFINHSTSLIAWITGNDHPSCSGLWISPQLAFSELIPAVIWSTATNVSSSYPVYQKTMARASLNGISHLFFSKSLGTYAISRMAHINPECKAAAEEFVKDGLDNSGFDAVQLHFKNGIWVKAQVAPVTIPYSGWVGLVGTLTDMTLTRYEHEKSSLLKADTDIHQGCMKSRSRSVQKRQKKDGLRRMSVEGGKNSSLTSLRTSCGVCFPWLEHSMFC
jgi:hypothetical protein